MATLMATLSSIPRRRDDAQLQGHANLTRGSAIV